MKQCDMVLHRGSSTIQHGHFNNRVYVMKLAQSEIHDILRYADDLAHKENYTKIFVKVPESAVEIFADAGYLTEATVPFFFHGKETAVFMAKYSDPKRKEVHDEQLIAVALLEAFGHAGERTSHKLQDGFSLMHAHAGNAEEIAALYRSVFKTYPFPVFDPDYIRQSMQGNTRYFVIKKFHLLAAVASCEIDAENRNAEVTDFATGRLFNGRGFASMLLHAIETELKKEGILLAYTIARASFGPINAVFAGAGYQFGGLLPNNTNICGSMESMNVWYKKLDGGKS
ncbi:MAG: putative beta-lysine N-acetyltransferase [Methanoregula sp.]|nr:putative beta-lysine N-acetyltransferase [Methanoregula sp.]